MKLESRSVEREKKQLERMACGKLKRAFLKPQGFTVPNGTAFSKPDCHSPVRRDFEACGTRVRVPLYF